MNSTEIMKENNGAKNEKKRGRFRVGMDYMWYALDAFLGLGCEAILAYLIEPYLYGCEMSEWNTWQSVCHWVATCAIWGLFAWLIARSSKKHGFDLFDKSESSGPVKVWQWLLIAVGVVISLVSTWIDWGGSKVLKEFAKKGLVKFIFQYIYYFFEVVLVLLIIVYGQKALETWFGNKNIPYGGIIAALTWGLGHWLTKGTFFAGLYTAMGGFIFGSAYLLTNRKILLSYILLCVMFIL